MLCLVTVVVAGAIMLTPAIVSPSRGVWYSGSTGDSALVPERSMCCALNKPVILTD